MGNRFAWMLLVTVLAATGVARAAGQSPEEADLSASQRLAEQDSRAPGEDGEDGEDTPIYKVREEETPKKGRKKRSRRVSLEELERIDQLESTEFIDLLTTEDGEDGTNGGVFGIYEDGEFIFGGDSLVLRTSFEAVPAYDTLRVALLLPLTNQGARDSRYVEFYQGFLFGLQHVKNNHDGHVQVDLFDTQRDSTGMRTHEIIGDPDFQAAHLIVGPVYEDQLPEVLAYAEQRYIPVVTPLADVRTVESEVLFQMAPVQARKYDKLKSLLQVENRHVTLLYGQSNDPVFEQEIIEALDSVPYSRFNYHFGFQSTAAGVNRILTNRRNNLIVVLSNNPTEVDRILASFASAQNNLTARGYRLTPFSVVGNPLWNRFESLDRTLFFKDRVVMFTNHHAKRDDPTVRAFDNEYVRSFGQMPSPYAYRGYDAAMIFVPAMRGDITTNLEGMTYTPLVTTYDFQQRANQNWVRVQYNNDFSITIE